MEQFTAAQKYQIVVEYAEVESDRKKKRPELLAALAQCRKNEER